MVTVVVQHRHACMEDGDAMHVIVGIEDGDAMHVNSRYSK